MPRSDAHRSFVGASLLASGPQNVGDRQQAGSYTEQRVSTYQVGVQSEGAFDATF